MNQFNEYSAIAQVAVRNSENAFINQQKLRDEWKPLRFHDMPDIDEAHNEYDQFRRVLFRSRGRSSILFLHANYHWYAFLRTRSRRR